MENNAWRTWPEISLFSNRISLFSTFATVETGHHEIRIENNDVSGHI